MKTSVLLIFFFNIFGLIYATPYHLIDNRKRAIETIIDDKPTDHAKVARNLVHKSNWASMGSMSTDKELLGFPMVQVIAVADSAKAARSTGNIYFYLTTLDFTGQDIKKNNKITVLFSDDEDLSCTKKNIDPMEPTCARAIISGRVIELDEKSNEYNFANQSFIDRHPAAYNWLKEHIFFLCKLEIENIYVLDYYGGPHNINVEDYYNANSDEFDQMNDDINTNEIPTVLQSEIKKGIHIKINPKKYHAININIE